MPRSKAYVYLLFAAALLAFSILNAIGAPFDFQSDHRLLPIFLFADGHPMYADPAKGPIYSSHYPPLSSLVYFPALLFRHPVPAILTAKMVAQILTVWPILILLWSRAPKDAEAREKTVALLIAALAIIGTSDMLSEMTILHADAPALSLSFLACVLTYRCASANRGSPSILSIAGLALCCALVPWAKQTGALIVALPPIAFLILRQWRNMLIYILAFVLAEAAVSSLFLFLFRHENMVFWLFEAPAHEMSKVPIAKIADAAMRTFLLIWAGVAFVLFGVLRTGLGRFTKQLPIYAVFVIASILGLPLGVSGFAKPGGYYNSLLYFGYFLFVAGLLIVQDWLLAWTPRDQDAAPLRLASYASLTVCFVAMTLAMWLISGRSWLRQSGFELTHAYNFMRANPGKVWFTRYPLTSYLAEGKLYHCDMGLYDRQIMGFHTPDPQLQAFIPNEGRLIACSTDCGYLALDMKGYRKVSSPVIGGTWSVFEKIDGAPFRFE